MIELLEVGGWVVARWLGLRGSLSFLARARLHTPEGLTTRWADLERGEAGARWGAIILDEAGASSSVRCPPAHVFTGALLVAGDDRLRARYLPGLRAPNGATGVALRTVTVDTLRTVPGAPLLETGAEVAAWLATLG